MNIVKLLKNRCEQLGISLHEVCRLANVPRETLMRWEKEEPKTMEAVRKVGAFFNIENPLLVLPHLKEWAKNNSIHALSIRIGVDYRCIKRWIHWKGTPKTIVILESVESVLSLKEKASKGI